jgi:hypothetical protein
MDWSSQPGNQFLLKRLTKRMEYLKLTEAMKHSGTSGYKSFYATNSNRGIAQAQAMPAFPYPPRIDSLGQSSSYHRVAD